jgi:hypothetical protein
MSIPEGPHDYVAVLHLGDVMQYLAAHHELVAVGAVEESEEMDEEGHVTTLLTIRESSPRQRAEDEWRFQQLAEQRAVKAEHSTAGATSRGNVYLIRETLSGHDKIGYSGNVSKRHKGIQVDNPNLLELLWHTPGDRALESALHDRFKDRRIRGEWFDFSGLDAVEEVRRAAQQILQGGSWKNR